MNLAEASLQCLIPHEKVANDECERRDTSAERDQDAAHILACNVSWQCHDVLLRQSNRPLVGQRKLGFELSFTRLIEELTYRDSTSVHYEAERLAAERPRFSAVRSSRLLCSRIIKELSSTRWR
jgi:hypothetical protein